MKRVKFQKFNLSTKRILFILFSFIIIVVGFGIIKGFESNILISIGVIFILFECSRLFWYKNYIKYTADIALIKLNSSLPKLISFKSILKVHVDETHINIITQDKNPIALELKMIERNDIDDLADVLVKYSGAEYVNEVMDDFYINKN